MGPEILVVGEVAAHRPLWNSIQDAGFEVLLCMEHELEGRLSQAPLPAAMVLSMDGTDYAAVLGQCRRHPGGASLPVVLLAHAQGPVGSLSDLMEMGADQVLYSPVDPSLMNQALHSLAGPGRPPVLASPRRPRSGAGRRKSKSSAQGPQSTEDPVHPPAPPSAPDLKAVLSAKELESGAGQGAPPVSELHFPEIELPETLLEKPAALSSGAETRDEISALEALSVGDSKKLAIEQDLAAFRVEDLPRIDAEEENLEGSALDADSLDASPGLFGAQHGEDATERTSTHLGRPLARVPLLAESEIHDPFGSTAEIPREEMPTMEEEPEDLGDSRQELARLARRLEARSDPYQESAGRETIRIQSRYSEESDSREETVSAPAPSGIKGQTEGLLSQVEVPRLLWELARSRFDGVLDLLTADDSRLRIAWRKGNIRSVRGSDEGDSLPASLWRRLSLTKAQYEELRQIPNHSQVPETMVAHLVRRGWLGVDEEAFALSRWIEDTVLRWWTVSSGRWSLIPDADHWLCSEGRSNWDVASVFLSACTQQVTPALARLWLGERDYEPRQIQGRVPSGLEPSAWLAQRFDASPAMCQWLAQADGRPLKALEESVAWAERSDQSSMGLCYALQVLGLIELPAIRSHQSTRSAALLRDRLSARLSLALSGSYFEFLGLSAHASSAQASLAAQNLRDALSAIENDPQKRCEVEDLLLALRENLEAAQRVLGDEDARAMYVRTRSEESP